MFQVMDRGRKDWGILHVSCNVMRPLIFYVRHIPITIGFTYSLCLFDSIPGDFLITTSPSYCFTYDAHSAVPITVNPTQILYAEPTISCFNVSSLL